MMKPRCIALISFLTLCLYGLPAIAQSVGNSQIADANTRKANNSKLLLQESLGSSFDHSFKVHGDPNNLSKKVVHQPALKELDAFIKKCIYQGAFPGCQVFAAKDGEIIFQKNYGYYTYDRSQEVTDSSLYDIASVTKVAATTLAIMKLYEEGDLKLSATLKDYLPFVEGTDKADITIANLLTHQAGLKAWIPFYKNVLDSITGTPRYDLFRYTADRTYNMPVAARLYLKGSYTETVWDEILFSDLSNKGGYVYSDLDFYFLEKVVEAISGQRLDVFVSEHFYKPLDLTHTLYNPWKKGWAKKCVPTEDDQYFRFQLIQGYVHDPGAAMLGGVAGHAGVFSNMSDLAVLLQMLNNGGSYSGKRYLKKETIKLFSGYHSSISRRAYGFDKPEKEPGDGGPASQLCSKAAFGHQGFTGTCAWADPETGITFIFLSNRIYPSAENKLINRLDVRTKAQTYIYEALGYGSN